MKKENCQLVIIQHWKPKKISRQFLFIVVTCQSVAWNGIYPERWRLFCLALSKSAFLWTSPVFGSCFTTSAISFATGWDDLVLVICLFPLFVIILLSCDFCVRVDTVIFGNVTSNVFCILYIVSTSIRNGWGHTSWISTVQIQPEPIRPLRPRVMSQEDIPDENANMFCPLGCLTPGHSYAKSDCNGRTVYDCMLVTDGRLMTVHVTGGLLMNVYLWQVDCWWMCTCDRRIVDECVPVTGGLLMNVYVWQVDCWWMCIWIYLGRSIVQPGGSIRESGCSAGCSSLQHHLSRDTAFLPRVLLHHGCRHLLRGFLHCCVSC